MCNRYVYIVHTCKSSNFAPESVMLEKNNNYYEPISHWREPLTSSNIHIYIIIESIGLPAYMFKTRIEPKLDLYI